MLKAGRVLDVKTGRYLEATGILIDGERIKEVARAADFEARAPTGTTVLDLGSAIVLHTYRSDPCRYTSAADLMGWLDKVGSIDVGKYADLIAVAGDPLADVTELEPSCNSCQFALNLSTSISSLPLHPPACRGARAQDVVKEPRC